MIAHAITAGYRSSSAAADPQDDQGRRETEKHFTGHNLCGSSINEP